MPQYTEQQLQNAINHARKEPEVPITRIAALYEVNDTTLRRRLAGTQLNRSVAHRDEQLFSPGEEQAIAGHCETMADLGFPVTKDLLQRIAQDMVNSRNQPLKGKGGGVLEGLARLHEIVPIKYGPYSLKFFFARHSYYWSPLSR